MGSSRTAPPPSRSAGQIEIRNPIPLAHGSSSSFPAKRKKQAKDEKQNNKGKKKKKI
jgi:hypothetical protein